MKITVRSENEINIEHRAPILLSEALRTDGAHIDMPCGGDGRCGKCRITVTGDVSEPTARERALLSSGELLRGVRLACMTYALGDCTVTLDGGDVRIETSGENVAAKPNTYAVDIGTTTIAVRRTDKNGSVRTASALNPQSAYGADVMTRISYASEHGTDALTRCVRETVDGLKRSLSVPDDAEGVAVGNTVMLSLYSGIDPTPIGRYPYTPSEFFGKSVKGEYLPSCVSGFVGADVMAAVLASGMGEDKSALLCDIGTNGEIVYKNGETYVAVSAAAGPALEGAGISSGMRAATGAVDRVWLSDGKLRLHVIGDTVPTGICGGGLIDAVACLLRLDVIDETGYMAEPYDLGGVTLTPGDVRAFQLAKGAIRAAIETVTDGEDVDAVYVSGGFGSGIDVESAVVTGLLPERFCGKVHFIGNGALTGAVMLSDAETRRKYAETVAKTSHKELMTDSDFASNFMEYIGF